LAVAAAVTAILGGFCAYEASGPDRQLEFTREVPTSLPRDTLALSISSIPNWPKWFFSVERAERIDIAGRPLPTADQKAENGALIRLEVHPHKGQSRGSFDLTMQVTEYEPGRLIAMRLARDGSGRIDKVVTGLEWRIELKPGRIAATASARTRSWRSRLIGAISERVLMNQLFYPDVMALGEFTHPQPPNPYPAYGS
jgi:hypothetical protein